MFIIIFLILDDSHEEDSQEVDSFKDILSLEWFSHHSIDFNILMMIKVFFLSCLEHLWDILDFCILSYFCGTLVPFVLNSASVSTWPYIYQVKTITMINTITYIAITYNRPCLILYFLTSLLLS